MSLRALLAAAFFAVLLGGPAMADDRGPDELVEDLYNLHGQWPQDETPIWNDPNVAPEYFSQPLVDLIAASYAATPEGDVPPINGDIIYDAQDFDISDLDVGEADINGVGATVPVSFMNFGEEQDLTYSLVLTDYGWRIDDIAYSHPDMDYTLRSIVSP